MVRFFLKLLYFGIGLGLCLCIMLGVAISQIWSSLPNLHAMTDYRPTLPLRIYTSDHVLIGEFGSERRDLLPLNEIPMVMQHALLAAEDSGFYQHGGVDWSGVVRAALYNLVTGRKAQGASTISMQVARNFYLSSQKSFTRKFFELLLTYKIESELTKDQILELYMNQIYLGHKAYGFGAASKVYFGIPLQDVNLNQATLLAAIPKAPSRINPIDGPQRIKERQAYILNRMHELGYITEDQVQKTLDEPIKLGKKDPDEVQDNHAGAVAELARQLMYSIYKEDLYSRGLNVYLTINSKDQDLAYAAVHKGIIDYTLRHPYTGVEKQTDLPADIERNREAFQGYLDDMQDAFPSNGDLKSYLVLSVDQDGVVAARNVNDILTLSGESLKYVKNALTPYANPKYKIKRGSIIYVLTKADGSHIIMNMPTVEGAFVALNPTNGAIKAMVGGFQPSSFNRVTQAWRQPGSTFKPFVYAAALERGVTPQTEVSDQPFYSLKYSGKECIAWQPHNYGNSYEDSLTMRYGLYRSKNMVSLRILQTVGPDFATNFIQRFGFDPKRQPSKEAYLTMALGAGAVTPLQMATAYSAFANGGFRIQPYLIERVMDSSNHTVLMQAHPEKAGDPNDRILDPRTAYLMRQMLTGVATYGTAAKAKRILKRDDIAGKTGTTNNANDAWFAGFTPKMVAVAWVGYDQPKSLGERETGGGAALPIWIDYMQGALKGVPESPLGPVPRGLIKDGDSFWYSEFPPGKAISIIGASNAVKPEGFDECMDAQEKSGKNKAH